ncbi:Transcriptional initiation protein Tat [Planctomycetales bacterium 10988]|nr:Transcriptional initiation protein Tat [Planctomycetales bacterium 10988]
MNPFSWQISRRTLLQGAGVSLALPWLEVMAPRSLAATRLSEPPVRMAFLFMPNGVRPGKWLPEKQGPLTNLSPMLQPLQPVKEDIVVLSNLWNQKTLGPDGHYRKVAAWLTGTQITKTMGKDLNANGVSVDQLVAQKLGHLTPLASMELGTQPVRTGVDTIVGYTRVYGGYVSWSSPTTPVPKEIIPQLAFDRLFKMGQTNSGLSGWDPNLPQVQKSLARDDAKLLDLVLEDASRLKKRISMNDRRKMDEYLEAVRSIEQRIEHQMKPLPRWINEGDLGIPRPANGIPRDYAEHVQLMLDIILLAFWTDTTRVSSFMFGNAVSGQNFSFLDGVSSGHHQVSHHRNEEDKMAQYEKIGTWHVQQYSNLLQRMKSLKEGDSTLLDNSMVLFGSALNDGNRHQPQDLPLVLGGSGGKTIQTGRHLASEKNTPLCNLYVSMLHRMGLNVEQFGDSTGPLKALG